MCFRQVKTESSRKRSRRSNCEKDPMDKKVGRLRKAVVEADDGNPLIKSINFMGPKIAIDVGELSSRIIKWDSSKHSWRQCAFEINKGCPSKFLIMCLNFIQNDLQQNGTFITEDERPLFANSWGIEFWNCYANGNDVLVTNGDGLAIEKIAWITSTAADTISMKEKQGVSFNGPFLLYLVPSQEKAYKVRQVCKPLQAVGIHTVSLHSGASIDHQVNGLKSCEPEFLVSTPERLLELLSLKAVDISEVSLMVIDGLEAPFKGTYFDAVKSIRQFISGNPQTVAFCDCMKRASHLC